MPRSQPVILPFVPSTAAESFAPSRIFDVTIQPSTQRALIVVEVEGPPELLAKLQVKVTKLAE